MDPLSIGIALAGAVLLGIIDGGSGVLSGLGLGYLLGEVIAIKRRLKGLETRTGPAIIAAHSAGRADRKVLAETEPTHSETDDALLFDPPASGLRSETNDVQDDYAPKGSARQMGVALQNDSPKPTGFNRFPFTFCKRYLGGGNLMVRAGVIVLFFGIAFLVKYATERDLLPIELRLAVIAIFATGLTLVGWVLKDKKRAYALALQGGGIGILYLTIFGAARLYALIPMLMALGIMISLVAVSTLLSLLQNARTLVILGTVGGFLAPILTASGQGNHVMLFSYYLLLNIGILGVAWFKAWRELNLVGFVFTFGIGAVWGFGAYTPKYFATTEPFLILFFLIYFSLSILFALRQPLELKGYVDGTIVFGLPLSAFGLQSGMVGHTEFGLAASAVVLATLYILAATLLWQRYKTALKLLIEAFLALGIMFLTLAIPLASDGHWTIGTWALEGGALFWVGIRQQRLLTRSAGLFLQSAAAVYLLFILATTQTRVAMSGGLMAASILFVAYLIQTNSLHLHVQERKISTYLLAIGLVLWFGLGLHDIDLFFSRPRSGQLFAVFVAGSLVCFNRLAIMINWPQMRHVGLGLLPYMVITAAYAFEHRIKGDPFRHGWWLVWLFSFIAFYDLLKKNEALWSASATKIYHMIGGLLALFLLTWKTAYWTDFTIKTTETWPFAIWGLLPGLGALALMVWGDRLPWPVRFNTQLYRKQTVAVILLYLFCWTLAVCVEECDPDPLPYVPFFNPIDLVVFFVFLLTMRWHLLFSDTALYARWVIPKRFCSSLIAIVGWIWLSAMVVRTVHFWAKVPYDAPTLATSALVQASLSVLWSLYAMAVLLISTRKGFREGWIAGAGLLAIVVIKLFLVDLSGSGTIARIVSFVAVGILMLVIGYFSPLPPSIRKENAL